MANVDTGNAAGFKDINVLVVVDVENALATKNLQDNAYLVDNNKSSGSVSEGRSGLITACLNGQFVNWRVAPVVPQNHVRIISFSGPMIAEEICVPMEIKSPGDHHFRGQIQSRSKTGRWEYEVALEMNGAVLKCKTFIQVSQKL